MRARRASLLQNSGPVRVDSEDPLVRQVGEDTDHRQRYAPDYDLERRRMGPLRSMPRACHSTVAEQDPNYQHRRRDDDDEEHQDVGDQIMEFSSSDRTMGVEQPETAVGTTAEERGED